jgi:hypothetical protein
MRLIESAQRSGGIRKPDPEMDKRILLSFTPARLSRFPAKSGYPEITCGGGPPLSRRRAGQSICWKELQAAHKQM